VAALVVGTLAAAIVSLQAIVSQTSFHMQALEQQTQQLEQRYGQLKLTVAQLSSPERVAAAASRMGLRLPTDVHTITIPGLGAAAGSRHGRGATSFALKSILGEHP
jgi:cell division protein FtsL